MLKINRRELDAEVGLHRLKDAVTKIAGLLSKVRHGGICENLGRKQDLRSNILA